ncbi:hypothetical protein DID78_02235 [Candidatus Marinamargulisbacteria bacterium SCGC AG-343-D04]|nr:hypothetical protein DID78_02235 [Candidatus Marinamargulisbacteria bacterium SCGC AG-343-D04]
MLGVFSVNIQGKVFDKNRKGFIVGLGVGGHSTKLITRFDRVTTSFIDGKFSMVTDGTKSNTESIFGVFSSVKIGYGFTNQFLVYYLRDAAWYSINNTKQASGIMGIGTSYYFKPDSQTFFVSLGLGLGDQTYVDTSTEPRFGSAICVGLGFEFKPRLSLETKFLKNLTKDKDLWNYENEVDSFSMSLNYLWY